MHNGMHVACKYIYCTPNIYTGLVYKLVLTYMVINIIVPTNNTRPDCLLLHQYSPDIPTFT